MKFHVYRARDAFVLSPECMQAPIAVQSTHPAVCECGSFDLPAEPARQVLASVAKEGYAIVDQRDAAYPLIDSLCKKRNA